MFKNTRPSWATTSDGKGADFSNSMLVANPANPDSFESSSTTPDSIFHHSARTHDAILAESAARRQKERKSKSRNVRLRPRGENDAEKRDDSERKRSPEHRRHGKDIGSDSDEKSKTNSTPIKGERAKRSTEWTPSGLKKRRIGAKDAEALLNRVGMGTVISDDDDDGISEPGVTSGIYGPDSIASVADNNDGGEEDLQIQRMQKVREPTIVLNDDNEVSPELLERSQQKEEEQSGKTGTQVKQTTAYKEPVDPVVQILIDSPIPNTSPLIIIRKLSQRLQEVRLQWCKRQGFDEEFTTKVFLTFRGRRKYDVTAVKSLGLQVNEVGAVTLRNGDVWEEVDRIHLRAMTEEVLKEQEENEKALQHDTLKLAAEAPTMEDQQQYIKLLIRAKGQKDFKLKVKPETSVSRIIHAVKREYKISQETEAYIEFDGERLNSGDQVKDTDLEVEEPNCVEFFLT